MKYYEIPLNEGAQQFVMSLNGTSYQLTLIWRDFNGGGWFLDLGLPDGTILIGGIPLLPSLDLLAQYQHVIQGSLFVVTDSGENPVYSGLGTATRLYWVTSS